MNNYSDYTYIKQNDNFLTGDRGYDENDPNAPPLGDIITSVNGIYTFSYHFLITNNELSAANGYDIVEAGEDANDKSIQNIEYGLFVEGSHSAIENTIKYVMGDNTDFYSVLFTDVVDNISFLETNDANAAQINIGKIAYPNDQAPAYAKEFYNPVTGPSGDPEEANYSHVYNSNLKAQGDIWFNTELAVGWNNPIKGSGQYATIIHELGHALGLDHTFYYVSDGQGGYAKVSKTGAEGQNLDNQKYSIMSYDLMDGMHTQDYSHFIYPSGLQLYDIAALQEIYGSRNYATRADDTIYSKATAFASGATNEAFIYTIWDGGGTDTLSADGYYESGIGAGAIDGAKIDLRQGAFSSIGSSITAARAVDNVAIAFHTVIENATGTAIVNVDEISLHMLTHAEVISTYCCMH